MRSHPEPLRRSWEQLGISVHVKSIATVSASQIMCCFRWQLHSLMPHARWSMTSLPAPERAPAARVSPASYRPHSSTDQCSLSETVRAPTSTSPFFPTRLTFMSAAPPPAVGRCCDAATAHLTEADHHERRAGAINTRRRSACDTDSLLECIRALRLESNR